MASPWSVSTPWVLLAANSFPCRGPAEGEGPGGDVIAERWRLGHTASLPPRPISVSVARLNRSTAWRRLIEGIGCLWSCSWPSGEEFREAKEVCDLPVKMWLDQGEVSGQRGQVRHQVHGWDQCQRGQIQWVTMCMCVCEWVKECVKIYVLHLKQIVSYTTSSKLLTQHTVKCEMSDT